MTSTRTKTKKRKAKSIDKAASLDRLQALAANRIAIEAVTPTVDGGRFPAKVVAGQTIDVEADIVCDGHEKRAARVQTRRVGADAWSEDAMLLVENDRWHGVTSFAENDAHEMRIIAWRDLFATWLDELTKKQAAGVPIALELEEGRLLVEKTLEDSDRLKGSDRTKLKALAKKLGGKDQGKAFSAAVDRTVTEIMSRAGLRTHQSESAVFPIWADREKAAFSAWYEMFPRSMSDDETRHGTFDDVIAKLPYVRDLGFDVLYFPPIHPIGTTNRKGRNNSLTPEEGDVGVPYAIGSDEGGHEAIHPELGDFDDFARLISAAADHGLEIAIDFAIQCSPDHPWIRQHPEWFDWRPDGTIKFAENPPKKYEDIVNVHFYRDALPSLWIELRDIVLFWVGKGVKIFRVDNPHTKPLPFWEWMIGEVQALHPDTIFLAEAFTAPKMMKRLAKVGFNQSYSYFTWRNEKWEIEQYMKELTGQLPGWEDMPSVMRPNFFVNTPDINPEYLQTGGRAAHRVRLVLAASLAGNYGVYNGYEICDARPVPGKEEYLDSEKYQLRVWDMEAEGHIKDDIRLMNRIRREHPALANFTGLRFYSAWNDKIVLYAKMTEDRSSFVLFAVNLDPHTAHGASIDVPLWEFGLPDDAPINATDLVTGDAFRWEGKHQSVHLTPDDRPYAIWALHKPGTLPEQEKATTR